MSFIEWFQLMHGIKLVAHVCRTGNPASFSGLPVLMSVNSNHLIVASIMENANALYFLCEPSTRTPNKDCDVTFSVSI